MRDETQQSARSDMAEQVNLKKHFLKPSRSTDSDDDAPEIHESEM